MTFTYNSTLPNPPDAPRVDVAGMQQNTGSIANLIAVDHIGFNSANGGYHNVVHLNPPISTPTPVATIGELYALTTSTINVDQSLFYQSGGGRNVQLTMNIVPTVVTDNGFSYLPGAFIVQWGYNSISNSGSGTTVAYSIQFPNTLFGTSISINMGAAASSDTVVVMTSNRTSFTAKVNASGNRNCFWFAIGN